MKSKRKTEAFEEKGFRFFKPKGCRVWYVWLRGERYSTKAHSKEGAVSGAIELERQLNDPSYGKSHSHTLSLALDEMLLDRARRGCKPKTLLSYKCHGRSVIKCLEKRLGSDPVLSEINHSIVNWLIDERRKTPRIPGSSRMVSDHNISKELCVLRMTLTCAKRSDKFSGDIEKIMPDGFERNYQPRSRFLSVEEFNRLLGVLSPQRRAHVALAVGTGTRYSETLGLTRVELEAALSQEPIGYLPIRGTKTRGSDRIIPVVGWMRDIIGIAVSYMKEKNLVSLVRWANVIRELEVACAKAGIPKVTPNDLRRTLTIWMRDAGVIPADVAPILGHVDSRMVEKVYGRQAPLALGQTLVAKLAGRTVLQGEEFAPVSAVPGA
jgi:integrase